MALVRLDLRIPALIKTQFLLSFLLTFTLSLLVLVVFFNIQPQVPIFYSLALSSQYLAPKEYLFLLPGLSLLITVVHLFIAKWMSDSEPVMRKLFAWSTVGIQALLTIALVRILLIIT